MADKWEFEITYGHIKMFRSYVHGESFTLAVMCAGRRPLGSRNNLSNPAKKNKATELALSHCTSFNQF